MKKENSKNGRMLRVMKKATVVLVSLSTAALMVAMPAMEASAANWQDNGIISITYQAGDGSINNPFQITTAGQLAYLAEEVNAGTRYSDKYFILNNDISLAGNDWTPIGNSTNNYFSGTFNGAGHQITGITIGTQLNPNTTLNYMGLFGAVYGGSVENLSVNASIYSAFVSTTQEVIFEGALVGVSINATISNCSSSGTVSGVIPSTGGSSSNTVVYGIGGLLGVAGYSDPSIQAGASPSTASVDLSNTTECFSTVAVTASAGSAAGGFIGANDGGTVQNCYGTGNVSSYDDSCNGGFAGVNSGGIVNSYATGSVTGGNDSADGGLVGLNEMAVLNCYSTGALTGGTTSAVGGLVGYENSDQSSPVISKGYWNSAVTTLGVGTGTDSSTKMALSDMQNAAASPNFAATLNSNISSLSIAGSNPWDYVPGQNNGLPALATVTNIAVKSGPKKILYGKASALDLSGAALNVTYSDGTTGSVPVTAYMVSGFDSTTAGTKTVFVSYCGYTANFNVSVDVTSPTFGAVKYSTTALTNKNVTVTVAVSGATKPSLSHVYTANGSYTFTATDAAGNTVTKVVKVTDIDKTAPVIKANVGNTKKIHGKVTVTVTDPNLKAKTISRGGWTVSWGTGTFTRTGNYAVTATDKAGNKSSYTFTIY